jgi:hypothetical protein
MDDIRKGSRQQICGRPAPSYPLQLQIRYFFIGPAAKQPKLGLITGSAKRALRIWRNKSQPSDEAAEVVAGDGEDGVGGVAATEPR